MIKGTMNQMHNINNEFQGKTKKILTVCSAGLLRSATLQNVLISEFGYNVRNCGTEDYALIPISEALVKWADEIIFVEAYNFNRVEKWMEEFNTISKCHYLAIPDVFQFNDPKLRKICLDQYRKKILNE